MNQHTVNAHNSVNLHRQIVLIPRKEVERITGMSKSWLYQAMAAGQFPKPVVCSGSPSAPSAVRWLLAEVLDWTKARVRERDESASN